MNLNTSQRVRTDASTSSPATRVPPHWRRSQSVPVTPSIASKPSYGSKSTIICNAQQYGRGQPPNQPQQPMALARRPIYQPVQPQQPVFLNLSQVSDKQVITRNTGKNLGTMGEAWVDPQRLEVVSFEVESKRGVGSSVTGNVPLAMLKQIGDVVLVQDELPPDQVPLDARYGFVKLLGLEVRTRMGRVLGKVSSARGCAAGLGWGRSVSAWGAECATCLPWCGRCAAQPVAHIRLCLPADE